MKEFELWRGDCLELLQDIPAGSADMVLTDPPYGIIKGWGRGCGSRDRGYRNADWDTAIDPARLFAEFVRILRPNGRCVLFAQEPYTSRLIMAAPPALPFTQRAVWLKNQAAMTLGAGKQLCSLTEDICVFTALYRKSHNMAGHPLRDYFLQERDRAGLTTPQVCAMVGGRTAEHYFTSGEQFHCPTAEKYAIMQETGYWPRPYEEIKAIDREYKSRIYRQMGDENPAVFNLPDGEKMKSNVFAYKKTSAGNHPTEKPVPLLADLLRTYSRPGDLVVDATMGSGSTGVACAQTGRRFIGIEQDAGYFDIAKKRIEGAQAQIAMDGI